MAVYQPQTPMPTHYLDDGSLVDVHDFLRFLTLVKMAAETVPTRRQQPEQQRFRQHVGDPFRRTRLEPECLVGDVVAA